MTAEERAELKRLRAALKDAEETLRCIAMATHDRDARGAAHECLMRMIVTESQRVSA